jgi:CubicO group peptidase (beta-lactamase class C family)
LGVIVDKDKCLGNTEQLISKRELDMSKNNLLFSTADGQPVSNKKLLDQMQSYRIPGVSIAVINEGKLEWTGGYGVLEVGNNKPVTTDTLFQACSISKPITAVAAMYLVQQGKLDLDEDINQKLLSWKIPENEFAKDKKVTLRRLLSHTAGTTVSGFRGYSSAEQVPTLRQILDGAEPANSVPIRVDTIPGTQWRYSGGGSTVVQQLLIDLTGKSFPEIMNDLVLEKLEMKQSTYQQPLPINLRERAAAGHDENGEKIDGDWFTYPEMAAAGLWTTPADVARLTMELQKSRFGKSNRVLSIEMTNEMLSGQLPGFTPELVSPSFRRDIRNQGLGFQLEGEGSSARFSHLGSNVGYRCYTVAYSNIGQGAVVMTNSDNGFALIQEIIRSIATEYGWVD